MESALIIVGWIVGLLATVIVVFLVVAALQPEDFRISRSASMSAPASEIFPYVNNLHRFDDWSPFANIDPNMGKLYTGPEAGVGASYAWSGNSQAGEGKMTIVESQPNDVVRMKLEFAKPWACQNDVEFLFQPKGDQVVVSWTMTGKNNFMAKAFSLLMGMDRMVGGMFEEGLAKLKSLVEAGAKKPVA